MPTDYCVLPRRQIDVATMLWSSPVLGEETQDMLRIDPDCGLAGADVVASAVAGEHSLHRLDTLVYQPRVLRILVDPESEGATHPTDVTVPEIQPQQICVLRPQS